MGGGEDTSHGLFSKLCHCLPGQVIINHENANQGYVPVDNTSQQEHRERCASALNPCLGLLVLPKLTAKYFKDHFDICLLSKRFNSRRLQYYFQRLRKP